MGLKNKDSDEREALLAEKSGTTDDTSSLHHPSCGKWNVDTRMISSKLCFFFRDSIGGNYDSYLIVFLASIGLNTKEAGTISAIRLAVSALVTPLLGYIVDKTGRERVIFISLCLGAIVTQFPLPWIAKAIKTKAIKIATSTENHPTVPFTSELYYSMLLIISLSTVCINPLRGFVNFFVMNKINRDVPNAEFGRQALFGAIGFAISSAISGVVVNSYVPLHLSKYTGAFYVHLFLVILFVPCGIMTSTGVDEETRSVKKKESEKKEHGHFADDTNSLKVLLRNSINVSSVLFIISVFLAGLCNNVSALYLYKIMEDNMKASQLNLGLSGSVAGIGEIIGFFASKRVMKLLGSPINSVVLSIGIYAVRFHLLALMRDQWLYLPTQILHGVPYALFWTSATEYAYCICTPDTQATVFSILVNVYSNVGALFGSVLGGVVYYDYGGTSLFLLVSCLCTFWFIVTFTVFVTIPLLKQIT